MIRAALKNPHLIVVVALAVLVVGITSYQKIPADLLPIFRTPAVQIVTFYPGMPPEVMERDIMSRLERWTGQSVGIEHQEAKAMQGVCIVKDFFREDVSNEEAMAQVTSYADCVPVGTRQVPVHATRCGRDDRDHRFLSDRDDTRPCVLCEVPANQRQR